ncbi:MAG: protein-export chaperone SecB [Coriobacteriales bacterium]|jgi:preprotein translocase subunit SecB|nr:protein-export chaperone SecB [Coriobacteriales bacterium]
MQLNEYHLNGISIESIGSFNNKRDSIDMRLGVEHELAKIAGDAEFYLVRLDVSFEPIEDNSAPYRGSVSGQALFSFPDMEEEERDIYLMYNGTSILYGLLRAQVVQVTAQCKDGKMLLPAFDFINYFSGQDSPDGE